MKHELGVDKKEADRIVKGLKHFVILDNSDEKIQRGDRIIFSAYSDGLSYAYHVSHEIDNKTYEVRFVESVTNRSDLYSVVEFFEIH